MCEVRFIEGDILDFECDVICHQVNCQGVMGSGLASQIKNKYPNVFTEYKKLCKNKMNLNPLGCCQLVEVNSDKHKYVANLFGQDYYGRDGKQYTDYDALNRAFQTLKQECEGLNSLHQGKMYDGYVSIAFPYMLGCGLGGGDWNIVYDMICQTFKNKERYKIFIIKK